jgi:hypothetical protein
VSSGVTAAIPDYAGFNTLVAAKIAEPGNPIGVWLIGSDGGAVIGVNRAGEQQNKFIPHAGSVDATYVPEVTGGPQYRAVLACLEAP